MHPKLNKSTNNKKSSALSSIDVLSFNDLRENLPFTLELYKCTSTQTKKKKKNSYTGSAYYTRMRASNIVIIIYIYLYPPLMYVYSPTHIYRRIFVHEFLMLNTLPTTIPVAYYTHYIYNIGKI